jgi:hypothetical protein
MRTPAGTECPHYFADYHRGRSRQACRLLEANARSRPWTPDLCSRCRVPRIVMANACPNLLLEAQVASGFLGLGRRVEISARCVRSERAVPEPEIGCGLCHLPNPPSPTESRSR